MAVDKAIHFCVLLGVHVTIVSGLFASVAAVARTGLFVKLAFHFSFFVFTSYIISWHWHLQVTRGFKYNQQYFHSCSMFHSCQQVDSGISSS